ncbi:MAG: UPF0182 family protein [Gemmatimonadetes bacterium]|nr:UPF0182 family protein [Gemmatimonadota bacterium]
MLYHRNIVTRIRKALPFLKLDRDPYLVVADDGTLKWIQDAYTTSSRYPYSFRSPDGVTYMRNSVKVVIDAYDGTVTAYVSAPNDPLVRTWAKVFPGIFVPIDSMAKDLRAHVRYPDDMFRAQTALYSTYHMDKPEEFYHREDQWQVPVVTRPDEAVPFMRHIIMRLPDEPEAEFIYMAPFTPRGKDNLAAWMVARNDGAEYGKLRVYRFPRQSLVFGPRQIENRINQDTEIARQVSLWDQRDRRSFAATCWSSRSIMRSSTCSRSTSRLRGPHPRTQACAGGLREPGGDARDAGAGAPGALCRRGRCAHHAGGAGDRCRGAAPRRRGRHGGRHRERRTAESRGGGSATLPGGH